MWKHWTEMREATIDKIMQNLVLPEEKWQPMTDYQRARMKEVQACIALLDEDDAMPTPVLRERLMKETGMGMTHTYEVMAIAREAVAQRNPSTKRVVREMILEKARKAYALASTFDPEKQVEAIVKISNMLARAFATSSDDGELLNVAELVRQADIKVTVDVAALGIETTERDREELRRMMKEDGIEDAEVV